LLLDAGFLRRKIDGPGIEAMIGEMPDQGRLASVFDTYEDAAHA
jgi:hypothetical protein